MPGKRISGRAHHGPEEDRMRKPEGDRKRKRLRMKMAEHTGLSQKDAERLKRWRES